MLKTREGSLGLANPYPSKLTTLGLKIASLTHTENLYLFIGICDVSTVKKILRVYVSEDIFRDKVKPSYLNNSFYPSNNDIKNHIYRAQANLRMSKLDQENLLMKMKEWETKCPSSKFHFRPHSSNGDASKNLLFVHQEKWQQDLLIKYGNQISLLDATYKTTKYALSLFFLCVKTNSGYTVVGKSF